MVSMVLKVVAIVFFLSGDMSGTQDKDQFVNISSCEVVSIFLGVLTNLLSWAMINIELCNMIGMLSMMVIYIHV